jgi:hypothetical protein
MVLPKVTRQRFYASRGEPLEITVPEGEQCAKWRRYGIQSKKGGGRLGTIFVDNLEHRGKQRIATVRITDQPEFMAKVSGSTPDPSQSIDPDAELVPQDFQKRITAESKGRFAEHREEAAAEEEDRRQERAVRQEMREALRDLPPASRPYFLAGMKRAIQEQVEQMREAA